MVGWVSQYDSAGQVQVSDNVNGAWTRSTVSTTFNGGGDIAWYYVQNAAGGRPRRADDHGQRQQRHLP